MIKNELNLAGLYKKRRTDDWIIREYNDGYPYYLNGEKQTSVAGTKLYSYSKNYNKFDKEFSLFMWTNETDHKAIYNHFNSLVDSVTKPQLLEVVRGVKPIVFFDKKYEPKKDK